MRCGQAGTLRVQCPPPLVSWELEQRAAPRMRCNTGDRATRLRRSVHSAGCAATGGGYRAHPPDRGTTLAQHTVTELNGPLTRCHIAPAGWAMFVDDDFLFLGDMADLLDQVQSMPTTPLRILKHHPNNPPAAKPDLIRSLTQVDDKYAIMCVQHDYNPTVTVKLAGKGQEPYPRKNWSSMARHHRATPPRHRAACALLGSVLIVHVICPSPRGVC